MSPHIWVPVSGEDRHLTTLVPYCYWRVDSDHVALLYEELACLVAYFADLVLGDRSAGAQLFNSPVELSARCRIAVYLASHLPIELAGHVRGLRDWSPAGFAKIESDVSRW